MRRHRARRAIHPALGRGIGTGLFLTSLCSISLVVAAGPAWADELAMPVAAVDPAEDEDDDDDDEVVQGSTKEITVVTRPPAEAASSVHFGRVELARRPHANASDLLRQTPGLVVGQHAGGGKADQLFLRGFDADHGTDVALFVDGVPVNMTSHGHGQGYADSHWVIPEVIGAIDVHKGPYAARFGDFYTAGAVEMGSIDTVADGNVSLALSAGSELDGPRAAADPTWRLVGLASPTLSGGKALFAGEYAYTDGPFLHAQHFRRVNLFGKWSTPLGGGTLTLHTTSYGARWNQSGQVPTRRTDGGADDLEGGRFGSVDPTEGGASSRQSVGFSWKSRGGPDGQLRLSAYAVDYRLRLYSNFTGFERDPVNGDQIEQTDTRTIVGVNAAYSRVHQWRGLTGVLTVGAQSRADDIQAELWHDAARARLADCFAAGANPCVRVASRVRNLAGYVEEDVILHPRVHAIAGLRYDLFVWDVDDLNPRTQLDPAATTGGTAQRALMSPKLSVIVKAHRTVDVFVNGGAGFHSNDARAAVATRGQGALARALGGEVGARTRPVKGVEAAVAAWTLYLSSEQVWNGDAGGTEASDPTRRLGLDLEARWDVLPWLSLDANVAFARSTLVANQGNGGALALAPKIMGGGGVSYHRDALALSLRARGIGDRPANDDGSLTAEGYLIFDLVGSYERGPWAFGLTATNLLNAEWREAQFAETSRLSDEAVGVEDVNYTPGTPLVVLGTVGYTY